MEIEVKFSLRHPEIFRERLISMGAILESARHLEHNVRFDTPGGDLSDQKHILRLRQDRLATITYKHPLGQVERREEIEIEFDDYTSGYKLLKALGFTVLAEYEKYREIYRLDPALVMVDEMPIGFFVEIEGPTVESIRQMSSRLGLPWERRVHASYLDLLEQAGTILGFESKEFTFEKFEGHATIDPGLLGVQNVD
jgi:predicted adenylyl cyclase CyaB